MSGGVLITGSAGGIGASLMRAFTDAGWTVVGLDRTKAAAGGAGRAIAADLAEFCTNEERRAAITAEIREALGGAPLKALVNNAAVQILGRVGDLAPSDFMETMTVNAVAPFMLVKTFLRDLEAANGAVINIGSVHAAATKPGFAAYAASKAALHGLTRALAVDLGPKVRVVTLAPAATATPMLKAGFDGDPAAYGALAAVHPLQRIAEPDEIARLALFLASSEASFLTGTTVFADGGVLARLHDPA